MLIDSYGGELGIREIVPPYRIVPAIVRINDVDDCKPESLPRILQQYHPYTDDNLWIGNGQIDG